MVRVWRGEGREERWLIWSSVVRLVHSRQRHWGRERGREIQKREELALH